MTAPQINLAEFRVKWGDDPSSELPWWFPAGEVLALVAAVEAAQAFLATYDGFGTDDFLALRAALAPFEAKEKP